jgi:hypothetical protein
MFDHIQCHSLLVRSVTVQSKSCKLYLHFISKLYVMNQMYVQNSILIHKYLNFMLILF